jgi:Flp pilus assembly pilin Flp
MSPEMQYLWIISRGHLARAREDERGVSAVEWILITLALVAMAGVVTVIIRGRIEGRARDINL